MTGQVFFTALFALSTKCSGMKLYKVKGYSSSDDLDILVSNSFLLGIIWTLKFKILHVVNCVRRMITD